MGSRGLKNGVTEPPTATFEPTASPTKATEIDGEITISNVDEDCDSACVDTICRASETACNLIFDSCNLKSRRLTKEEPARRQLALTDVTLAYVVKVATAAKAAAAQANIATVAADPTLIDDAIETILNDPATPQSVKDDLKKAKAEDISGVTLTQAPTYAPTQVTDTPTTVSYAPSVAP